jgi:C4-dicarboxylate-specific signal transduction histidine kinase
MHCADCFGVNREVEISIGDTGTGIPEAFRDEIFDPFSTTKEVGMGTGQGRLPIDAPADRLGVEQVAA